MESGDKIFLEQVFKKKKKSSVCADYPQKISLNQNWKNSDVLY